MSQTSSTNPYLRTKVLTASPEELRLLLYEGAIRFCRQAVEALSKPDFEASYQALTRVQKIVLELSTSLNHSAAPELCERLGALYTYLFRRLVDANLQRDADPVRECIGLLEYERDTWKMLMTQIADDRAQPVIPDHLPQPTPVIPRIPSAGLCVNG